MMKNQVMVISGGSRGLGRALVSHFLAKGYCVATYSRKSSPFIDETLAENGHKESFYWESIDGTNYQKIELFSENVFKRFGRIDAVINNAGIGTEGVLTLMPRQSINDIIAINFASAVHLTKACTKYLLLKKGGAIINISSINGIRGHVGLSVYGATKAALDGFTRGLAKELGPRGIRVNSVAPGYLETEMTQNFTEAQRNRIIRRTPIGRLGQVDDVVAVIEFLLSPKADFITGQIVVVDGGLTC
jgi:3-oxoacyl-[acyl-carrier protein] reductase